MMSNICTNANTMKRKAQTNEKIQTKKYKQQDMRMTDCEEKDWENQICIEGNIFYICLYLFSDSNLSLCPIHNFLS